MEGVVWWSCGEGCSHTTPRGHPCKGSRSIPCSASYRYSNSFPSFLSLITYQSTSSFVLRPSTRSHHPSWWLPWPPGWWATGSLHSIPAACPSWRPSTPLPTYFPQIGPSYSSLLRPYHLHIIPTILPSTTRALLLPRSSSLRPSPPRPARSYSPPSCPSPSRSSPSSSSPSGSSPSRVPQRWSTLALFWPVMVHATRCFSSRTRSTRELISSGMHWTKLPRSRTKEHRMLSISQHAQFSRPSPCSPTSSR